MEPQSSGESSGSSLSPGQGPAEAADLHSMPPSGQPVQAGHAASPEMDGLAPQPVIRAQARRSRISLIWLLPLVAILVALSMAIHNWLNTGPAIQIRFKTAEGLVPGKSQVRYKEVVIGTVQKIALSENGDGVVVRVQLEGSASKVANTGSKFWIVRPQLGLGGVTGLGALLSGAYIGVDAGDYSNERQTTFEGMEQPPAVTRDSKGKRFYLMADSLGSLNIGSPVYYRRMPVGRVTSYALDKAGQKIGVEIFVDQPYDGYVTPRTRFWNASGVDLSLGSDGVKVNTESLAAIVAGGVAFANLPLPVVGGAGDGLAPKETAAAEGARFDLHDTQKIAFASRQEAPVVVRMRYDQSVRGLAPGAPVELRGKPVGEVLETSLDFDPVKKSFFVWVDALLYPRQSSDAYLHLLKAEDAGNGSGNGDAARQDQAFIRYLIEHGYRAQLKTGNLLTGQLYVAIEHFDKMPVPAGWDGNPVRFPTMPGNLDQLQAQLATIAGRLEKVRFDEIGADLQASLKSARRTLDTADKSLHTLTPDVQRMLGDAQKALRSAEATMQSAQQAIGPGGVTDQTTEAMAEVRKAARSLRTLSDSLKASPDALIRGRAESTQPALPVPQASMSVAP